MLGQMTAEQLSSVKRLHQETLGCFLDLLEGFACWLSDDLSSCGCGCLRRPVGLKDVLLFVFALRVQDHVRGEAKALVTEIYEEIKRCRLVKVPF
jgi:hypothetical protein